MYYFIGHDDPAPDPQVRYQAVTAAHITHMLRDTIEDTQAGYFNIPREVLHRRAISPYDVKSRAYREWVCGRVRWRKNFKAGRKVLPRLKACAAAWRVMPIPLEWMLRAIERDNYCLRSAYPERKSLWASLWMGCTIMLSMFTPLWNKNGRRNSAKMTCPD